MVVVSVATLAHPDGAQYTAPTSPNAQGMMNLTFKLLFVTNLAPGLLIQLVSARLRAPRMELAPRTKPRQRPASVPAGRISRNQLGSAPTASISSGLHSPLWMSTRPVVPALVGSASAAPQCSVPV